MKNLILLQPIVKASLWLMSFLFFINQKLDSMKQYNQTAKLKTTTTDSIATSEDLVIGELFQHWVDELRNVREIPLQLQEYFFSPPNSSNAFSALEHTIQKYLSKENQDQKTIVLDVIEGMKKTVDYYEVKDFEDLIKILICEKQCYQQLLEGHSNELEIKKTLSGL